MDDTLLCLCKVAKWFERASSDPLTKMVVEPRQTIFNQLSNIAEISKLTIT